MVKAQKQHKRKDTTIKTMQNSSISSRRRNAPLSKREELADKLFLCDIVAVIVGH